MNHQQIDYCLDLRELITLDGLSQVQTAPSMSMLLDASSSVFFSRVYLGSSFCPQSFRFSTPLMEEAFATALQRDIPISLSLPIVTQRNLNSFLSELDELLETWGTAIDELVANDLGMLGYLCDAVEDAQRVFERTGEKGCFFGKGVVVGRLLNKDTRDPRDPEYPWVPRVPNMLQTGWEGSTFLEALTDTWTYWSDRAQEYRCPVVGIELDPTHETLLVNALPSGMTAALNGPLCYMSTGQICEYASIGLLDEQAFRPNSPCAAQCSHTCIRYQGVAGVEFVKLGRTVYFAPSWETRLEGVGRYRQLVSLLEEVHG